MKELETIYREMLDTFAARTGYRIGDSCELSVRLYAVAAQVQALLSQAEWVLGQAFPQTAAGEYLDRHAALRNLRRREAAKATGMICFYKAEGTLVCIPAGTVCMTAAGTRFETTEDITLGPEEIWGEVSAEAVESGSAGNAAAGSIVMMAVAPAGVLRCENPEAFAGGEEEEEDESLRSRILESYRRLPNGANAAYYEQETMAVSGVAAAQAVGRARGIGTVDVYIASAAGIPGEDVLREAEQRLQEQREIAVDVRVLPPEEKRVDFAASITPAPGWTYEAAAAEAETMLRNFFDGTLLGAGVTRAELGNRLYELGCIANYAISVPEQDVSGAVGVLPVLGSITLERGE